LQTHPHTHPDIPLAHIYTHRSPETNKHKQEAGAAQEGSGTFGIDATVQPCNWAAV
jgi:hypothetical protein